MLLSIIFNWFRHINFGLDYLVYCTSSIILTTLCIVTRVSDGVEESFLVVIYMQLQHHRQLDYQQYTISKKVWSAGVTWSGYSSRVHNTWLHKCNEQTFSTINFINIP